MAVFSNNPRIQQAWMAAEEYRNKSPEMLPPRYLKKIPRDPSYWGVSYRYLEGYQTNPNEMWVAANAGGSGAVENPDYIRGRNLAAAAEANLKAVMKQEADKIEKQKKVDAEKRLEVKHERYVKSAQDSCATKISNLYAAGKLPANYSMGNSAGLGPLEVGKAACMQELYQNDPKLSYKPTFEDVEREVKAGGSPKQGGNSKPLGKPKGNKRAQGKSPGRPRGR